ncbi:MAG: hypothetical protein A2015_13785 [Spirochaetes bacterium GWF1_31_7]|nr:MAG: hypothetical protein A2Y30_11040 [Spirochaetes bacterium GWE1_32_154]OHD46148.1 MAG: hypothetical protein A2Y29_08580 [Spirochaetes bacterium GWE2_31_10]OHD49889.1 MAG: hypothetical protein A2015_13785 [Spirochaetes bacterium GWF1_31_7]OHD78899.1 MAG: hypothetical protein A2355_01555 [Spirochaetes bacterium RIFOXYB1_FULL_32_8]HBD96282.1 hypothetical protein [Spirochaetia bacterium]
MRFSAVFFFVFIIFSCSNEYKFRSENSDVPQFQPFPEANFAIVTDLHYYDKSLGIDGAAFKNYIENDRKLLLESGIIIDTMFDRILKENIQFLIISGDITKDSELINHQAMIAKLQRFRDKNIKVFCIPGNHDIKSGDGVQYIDDKTIQTKTINEHEFQTLYADLGFNDAIDRDKESLSYLVEPVSGLWLLALDSTQWGINDLNSHPETDGAFKHSTLEWIENVLQQAQKQNKAVIGTMHHGILEHYPANEQFYGEYVVNNYNEIAKLFSYYKMNFVFTGHFHSQDVTSKKYTDGNFIFDIETGSPVTYPSPYRVINISHEQRMNIKSEIISSLESIPDFENYSHTFVTEGTKIMASKTLKKFKVRNEDIDTISDFVAKAYVAHLKGDEIPPEEIISYSGLSLWSKIVTFTQKDLIYGWWTDLPPNDNNIVIDLKTGAVIPN